MIRWGLELRGPLVAAMCVAAVFGLALAASRAQALSTACGTDQGSGYMAIEAGPGETNRVAAGSRNGAEDLGARITGTNAMGDPVDFSMFCGPNPGAVNHTLTMFLGDGKDLGRADGEGAETIGTESGFGPVHRSIVVTILGGEGKDKLIGHKGDGMLGGGTGRDRIKDKGGNDLIKGGPGRDKIKAKDGDADLVICDRQDEVKADPADTLRGC